MMTFIYMGIQHCIQIGVIASNAHQTCTGRCTASYGYHESNAQKCMYLPIIFQQVNSWNFWLGIVYMDRNVMSANDIFHYQMISMSTLNRDC